MIEVLPETGSTNADLAARLRDGETVPEGFWLVANRQTGGRGRQEREWRDGAGNFMGSTVVHLRHGDPAAGTLALLAGLAVFEVVSPCVTLPHEVRLKWPNDVMVGGAKLAGILLERERDAVVVGIGVNLADAPVLQDREAISLSQLGTPPDRDAFAGELARLFDVELERWRNYRLGPIVQRWLKAGHPPGTPLVVGEPRETPLQGTFAGLTDEGALLLRFADGTTRTINAGEVRLAGND